MAHTYSKLIYHCIFGTKDRQSCLAGPLRERVHAYIAGVVKRSRGHLLKAGGTPDHVHPLMELKADTSVAEAMRVVKANSSKWVHQTFPEAREFAWQTGYGAFSVSLSAVDDVMQYLENQEEHHRTRTFQEEFVAFLRRHGIAYDDRYLWA